MEQIETNMDKIEKLDPSPLIDGLMKYVDEVANYKDSDMDELEGIITKALYEPDHEVSEAMAVFYVIMHVVKEKKPELFKMFLEFSKLFRDFWEDEVIEEES